MCMDREMGKGHQTRLSEQVGIVKGSHLAALCRTDQTSEKPPNLSHFTEICVSVTKTVRKRRGRRCVCGGGGVGVNSAYYLPEQTEAANISHLLSKRMETGENAQVVFSSSRPCGWLTAYTARDVCYT